MNAVMQKYRVLGKKGEGTFSEVLKCQSIKDSTYWACKKMKQHYESIEQVNNLREIQAMRRLSPHPNILELQEVVFDKKTGTLALICELMDMNIYELIRGRRHYLPERKIKRYMYQLLRSLDHMHRNGIFHRDVKPENILIKDELLKLADFGSCRSIYSKQPYTEYISTRWYRAPECLLTDGYYGYKMDMWSVGCVFFEVMSLHPLFPGSNEVDQIAKIHDIMGTPDPSVLNKLRNKARGMNFNFPQKKRVGIDKLLPHATPECIELIYKLCEYDPDERMTARQALRHAYFKDLSKMEAGVWDKPTTKSKSTIKQRDAEKKAAKMQLAKHPPPPAQIEPKSLLIKSPVHVTVLRQVDPNKPAPNNTLISINNKPTVVSSSLTDGATIENNVNNDHVDNAKTKISLSDDNANSLNDKNNVSNNKDSLKTDEIRPDTARSKVFVDSVLKDSYLHKQERKRRRHKRTFGDLEKTGLYSLPKVSHGHTSYQPSFNANTYQTTMSFPKLNQAGLNTSPLFPSMTSSFKPKNKPAQQTATKSMFSHYQLPSIDRRGAGF